MGRGSGRRGHRGREGGGCRNVTREPALAEGISSAAPPSLRHSLLGLAGHQRRPPPLPTPPSCLSSPLPSLDGPFSPATPWQLPPPPPPRQLSLPGPAFIFPHLMWGNPRAGTSPPRCPPPRLKLLIPLATHIFCPAQTSEVNTGRGGGGRVRPRPAPAVWRGALWPPCGRCSWPPGFSSMRFCLFSLRMCNMEFVR